MLSRKTLLALAAALLAAIGWFALQESEAPDDPLLSGSAAPTDGADVGAAELQGLVVDEARIAAGGDDDPGATEASPAPAAHDGLLTGIVLSETSGAPLPGARVTVTRRIHSEFRIPDMTEREAREEVAEGSTDAAGRFELAVPAAVPLDLEARADRHAVARRSHVFAGEDLVLQLAEAAILEGTLTRTTDGSPVEGALILGRDDRRLELCRARTGLAGDFLFEDLPPGLVTLQITPEDAAVPPDQRVELRDGASLNFVKDAPEFAYTVHKNVPAPPPAARRVVRGRSAAWRAVLA